MVLTVYPMMVVIDSVDVDGRRHRLALTWLCVLRRIVILEDLKITMYL